MIKEISIIIIIISLLSCSGKDANRGPKTFIDEASSENLSILFNVSIEARNEENNEYHYYYSHVFVDGDTIILPSYEYFNDLLREDSTYLKEILKFAKNITSNEQAAIIYAKKYAFKLNTIYKKLGVINSVSIPKLGRFIKFTLNSKCNVYYLEDFKTLTPYWKNYFNKLNKVDEKWFYECR